MLLKLGFKDAPPLPTCHARCPSTKKPTEIFESEYVPAMSLSPSSQARVLSKFSGPCNKAKFARKDDAPLITMKA